VTVPAGRDRPGGRPPLRPGAPRCDTRPMTARDLGALALALPDGFAEAPDGAPGTGLRFRGPAGEALRVSEAAIDAGAPEAQQRMLRDRLVQGAIRDVQRETCRPGLEVFVPLSRAVTAHGVETWSVVARGEGEALVAQAVVAAERGVAILRWEGPNARASIARWFGILESVRPAGG
jgi:hypothetical protein